MRLPIFLMSFLVGVSVPALAAVTLSGKVIDQSGAGKAGVTVSFQGVTAKTGTDGTWSLPGVSTGISSHLSNGHQVTTGGGHLVLDEGHLRVSLSGYDLMGRPRSGSSTPLMPLAIASGVSARATTSGIDTIQYLWNTKTFLRDTASVSRSGIVAIFDTIPNDSIIYGWLTDVRDSQVYRTVKIGTQTWMAQNLNYKVDSSWCYDDSTGNCSKYGRLYQWAAAMDTSSTYNSTLLNATLPHQGICPSGWHVPSDAEWSTLVQYVDSATSGTKLKANSSLWRLLFRGTDVYGFSVLPTGRHNFDGTFHYLGYFASFWSSSEDDASCAWYRHFYYADANMSRNSNSKSYGLSLRCLQNSSNAVTVTSRDSTLSSLTSNPGGLIPTFSSSTQTYKDTVPYDVTSVTLSAAAATVADIDSIRYNGSASGVIPLSRSSDTTNVLVVVYNKNMNRLAYTVKIIKVITFTDARDGQTYKFVKIGTQTWMAQNLNYAADSSWCYGGIASNCSIYGRLYQWSSAMAVSSVNNSLSWVGSLPPQGICPNGWHIPSDVEWSTLVQYVDSATSGTKLKANSTLWSTNAGTDVYGFSALPAGYRNNDGSFDGLGSDAAFWSFSEYVRISGSGASDAWYRNFYFSSAYVGRSVYNKTHGFSVRCAHD